jgi:hypothetical protein
MVSTVTDDPGVMGNLPRSRPGRRSEKRAAATKPAKATAAKKRTAAKPSPKTASKASAKPARARSTGQRATQKARPAQTGRAPRTAVRDERVEERQGQDPITAALRAGMAVGDAGVKVLAKIVQRLPRP